jgi:poly(3-hydroxybutyrate) depolymerase
MFDAWAPAAEARRLAVLAPSCPRADGCTSRSWWQWNGEPQYLLEQIRALAVLRPVDAERIWIVGWSGGASYIGLRAQQIDRSFAAVVVEGGGVPPAPAGCSTPKASVHFLVGDANPLHGLAVRLRDYYLGCGHEVIWTLIHGADHEGERRAASSRRAAILDWLVTKRLQGTAPHLSPRAPD